MVTDSAAKDSVRVRPPRDILAWVVDGFFNAVPIYRAMSGGVGALGQANRVR